MGVFRRTEIITCHDNLLLSLYGLGIETIVYKEINGESYLVNNAKGKGYEIGLKIKIDKQDMPQDIPLVELSDGDDYGAGLILNIYSPFLTFSNIEKFIANILLDKYLANDYEFDISLKEIECSYRKKALSYRNITLNTKTYNRYVSTIDSLSKKEIYLKTSNSFRKDDKKSYGVAGIALQQKFLRIISPYSSGVNNVTFSYSFDGFGNVIKKCKRYSNIVPRCFYTINFNQTKLHLVAFYLAQEIFWQRWVIQKAPYIEKNYYIDVDIDYITDIVEEATINKKQNKSRNYKRIVSYIEQVLYMFRECQEIEDYREEFIYDETERFMSKHEYDYDIETDLENYNFTLEDLDQDVSVKFTIIMQGAGTASFYNI